jgi:hypothetical protein
MHRSGSHGHNNRGGGGIGRSRGGGFGRNEYSSYVLIE